MKINYLSLTLVLTLTFSCSTDDSIESAKEEVIEEQKAEKPKNDKPIEEPIEKEPTKEETKIIDGIKYGSNFIVFEPEVTKSNLGKWVKRVSGDLKYFSTNNSSDAINKAYLEFTGNNLNGGQPNSPLEYTFTCPKTASYNLIMRMLQPLLEKEPQDKRNDVWIKLSGNFTANGSWTTEALKKDHKFFGRGPKKWGSIVGLEGHLNGKKKQDKPIYNLIEGESYTFTMSGRAQGTSIDYILFFEKSLNLTINAKTDPLNEHPEIYRPDSL